MIESPSKRVEREGGSDTSSSEDSFTGIADEVDDRMRQIDADE